jgi:hypothetical protein
MIKEFFRQLDKAWKPQGREPITLPVIGSTALFLQCDYERGTKDSDILELEEIPEGKDLLELAGEGSAFAAKHRMYLQIVTRGFPFLPPQALFHPVDSLNKSLKNFQVKALDIVDVVVSKLKPFRVQDQDDIQAVVNLGLVDPDKLLERFILTKERWLMDSRGRDLPGYIENLNLVQRDWLLVGETEIELPGYIFEA